MPRLATFALLLTLAAPPLLAQQAVYPKFPPPPAPTGDAAPHPQPPDTQDSPAQHAYPDGAAPQKPSPYPPPSPDPQADQAPPSTPSPAQQPPAEPAYPQAGYPPAAPYSSEENPLGWVPRGMERLGRTAPVHTDFTFDRSMLQLASGLWDGPADPATASALSRLNGVSVHSYHYAGAGMYDPRLLDVVRHQYSALGWQHLVTAHARNGEGATDLWISFHHLQVTGAVVLFENATNLNLIAFSGNLSPLDILHLRGHFGIPPFPGDHFGPAPGSTARIIPPPQ